MRTAIITKIKGLSIQTQQSTVVLFTLFKLTLDEHKTLTKISTRKPLTTIPQTSANFGTRKPAKSILHNWWRIRALGFHQETTEESGKHQELVLYKILHYFVPDYLHLAVWF